MNGDYSTQPVKPPEYRKRAVDWKRLNSTRNVVTQSASVSYFSGMETMLANWESLKVGSQGEWFAADMKDMNDQSWLRLHEVRHWVTGIVPKAPASMPGMDSTAKSLSA